MDIDIDIKYIIYELKNDINVLKNNINELKNCIDELKNNTNNNINDLKTISKTFKKELKGLVEIQQKLIHERLGVEPPPPPKEYGEDSTNNTTKTSKIDIVSIDADRIRISGNTFDYKSCIKNAGNAKWEQSTKSWSLPSNSLDQLISNFESMNLVKNVDFSVNVKGLNNKDKAEDEEEGFGSGF